MDRVGGTGRNQADIDESAGSPGVSLVDGVAVSVHQQGPVKVCAFLHRAFAAVFHHPAPVEHLAFVVRRHQFEPHVEGINRAAGEKVAEP